MWQVAKWTWAFFMDKNEKVHWSCQTDDGSAIWCSGDVMNKGEILSWCLNYTCIGEEPGLAILISWSNQNLTWYTKRTLYTGEEVASGHKCAYICDKERAYPKLDPDTWELYCQRINDICKEKAGECRDPFSSSNIKNITGNKVERTCTYREIERTCVRCDSDNGYEWKDDTHQICIKRSCHHCAKNGFPYCFPINFNSACNELNRMN
jgi:hypothetical protein